MKHLAVKQPTDTPDRWVQIDSAGSLQRLEDLDGVHWSDAPVPPRWHRCKAQTQGLLPTGWVSRCACGAISKDGRWWSRRNSRRHAKSAA